MIGKTIPEYIFIRFSILGLRLIAPASLIYLGYELYLHNFRLSMTSWLDVYALLEAFFYVCVYIPRHRYLQKAAVHPPILSREERRALFEKCANYLTSADYPSGWFFSLKFKRQNLAEWLLWALFSTTPDHCLHEWEEELAGYITAVENVLGRGLEPGHSAEARCMRLTFDPVVMLHRPFIWYMIVAFVDLVASLQLYTLGFCHYPIRGWFKAFPPRLFPSYSQKSVDGRLSYWYRPHRSKTKLPVLFLHGIGIGLYPYIPFLSDFAARDPDVGILVIEFMSISMHMTSAPYPSALTCSSISRILDSLNLQRVVVMSHSYGTVITSHMFHSPSLSPRIAATLLVDPIPFLLHLPDVAYNFVYRYPRTANEWQLWYFTSRDADISRTLSRHFFWADNVLWAEDLQGKAVTVVLSGADQIVNSEEVRKYLTGQGGMSEHWSRDRLEVLFYPSLDHATIFDTKKRRKPLLDVLSRFVTDA
ncbi:hypothetical protein BV22DRAFT_756505 [Leucogyrophana mollusca]|uniref:Uncharacterized protein n=1 Tax=Leucogyrophana mollusca TaxID=85980 RepID=A0ACB8B6I6_9AGAM|nr:hypothetical protein BV22DRAFT_756505 [Leucogyrophana mollusca]